MVPGGNSGWDPRPNMAGRGDCPDDYCGYQLNQNEGMDRKARAAYMSMTDFETYPDAMKPLWTNDGYSQGISSAAFLKGEQWGGTEPEGHLMRRAVLSTVTIAPGLSQAQAGGIDAGKNLYASNCAQCHGPTAKGMASFPSLIG